MSKAEFDRNLLALLPPWYRDNLDYQQICSTEETAFDTLFGHVMSVTDNLFFQTMDEGAVRQWESVLSIIPNPLTETLEFRRARLINRINTRPPFTLRFLYQKLDELIAPNQWQVAMDYANHTLYVQSSAENQLYAIEIAYTMENIKPAHIVYINAPFLQTGLVLSEEIELFQQTFHYTLGSWGLGTLPFATDQSKGVIKMPETPSIQQQMLTDIAGFVAEDIAKVRINGVQLITDLLTLQNDHSVTVSYTVSREQVEDITKLELLDRADRVLTSSAVYVPIASQTMVKHVIPVKEG